MITIKETIIKTYNFSFPYTGPFINYDLIINEQGGFKNAEKRGHTKCFWCKEHFVAGQDVYIGFGKGTKNRLFCKKCYEKGREQEEKQ